MATPRGAEHRDLEERFRKAEQALRELRAAVARRPQFELSSGDLTISGGDFTLDGGDFNLLDTDGSVIMRIGQQINGDRGLELNRASGAQAMQMKKVFANSSEQTFSVKDSQGNTILGEGVFGPGHEEPFWTFHVQPVAAADGTAVTCGPHGWSRATTSATFEPLFHTQFRREHPYSRWEFAVSCETTADAAELRVVDQDGFVLAGFFQPPWVGVVAAGTTGWRIVNPGLGLHLPDGYGQVKQLRVEGRRTAGTGTIHVAVRQAQGGPA